MSSVHGPDDPTLCTGSGGAPEEQATDEDLTRVTAMSNASAPLSDVTQATLAAKGPVTASGLYEGTEFSDYRIERKLGQGGMGTVYLGWQKSLGRQVAIKVLPANLSADAGFKRRFELEAQAVAQLSSPHIIQVYGLGEYQGHHYFVMEYVAGQDLAARIRSGARPSYQQSIELMIQAARGLEAAGRKGLVHRDIKPSNMMVTEDLQLKLMDFGLVKQADAGHGLTMAGTVMGTVHYFSPEQGRGETCDQRTDIYAMGVVLYELVTGALPFVGQDATSIIYQHNHTPPRPPTEIKPDIPESLQAIILKCMQKKPVDRYQTATELVADLDAVARGGSPVTALGDPHALRSGATLVRTRPFAGERRGPMRIVSLVLGTLAAVGAGAYWWQQQRRPAEEPSIEPGGVALSGDGIEPTATELPPAEPTTAEPGPEQALARARTLLGDGRFDEVATLIAAQDPETDPAWGELAEHLNQARAVQHLHAASTALDAGELAQAEAALARAADLVPELEGLSALRQRLDLARSGAGGMQEVQRLLAAGRPDRALVLIEELRAQLPRSQQPQVERLEQTAKSMAGLLESAHHTLAGGDIASARSLFTQAQTLLPNEAARQGLGALRQVEQLFASLAAGNSSRSRQLLDELATIIPGAPVLAAGEAGLARQDTILRLRQALAEDRLDEARGLRAEIVGQGLSGTELDQLDAAIAERVLLGELRSALNDGDLAKARVRLERLQEASPSAEVLALARRDFEASRLEEDERRQQQAAREASYQERVKAVRALIDAEPPDVAEVEAAIAGLAEQAEGRAEPEALRLELRRRLDRLAIIELLAALDRAVHAGDRQTLDALVADDGYREILAGFIGQTGLIFTHRLQDLVFSEDGAEIAVMLRNGFQAYPENDLVLRYRMQRREDAWVIVGYTLVVEP